MLETDIIILYPAEAKYFGFTDEQIEKADKTDGKLSDMYYLNRKLG